MKDKILLAFALLCLLFAAACDCDDDPSTSSGQATDDDSATPDDDDNDDNDDNDATPDDDDDDDTTPTDDDIDDDTTPTDDDTGDDDTGDDDTVDDDTVVTCDWPNYNTWIVAGKAALGNYDPGTAWTAFDEAVVLCPEVGDGQLGQVLANFQAVAQALQAVLAEYPEFPFIDWAAFQQSIVNDLLPLNNGLSVAAEAVQTDFPENRLFVPSFPLLMSGETVVIDGSGEWDYADFVNIGALAYLFDAIERFLLAFQLEADWTLLQNMPYLYDPIEIVHWVCGQLLLMFADPNYPDFLTFTAEGAQYFADFAISLGFAAIDGQYGFESVLEETDPQQDDITGYVDKNGNGQWDEGEPYSIPFWGPLGDEMNLFFLDTLVLLGDLGPALLDRGPEDLRPLQPDWFPLSDLDYILAAIQGWIPGLTLPDWPIPVGRWFYNPPEDGLRTVAITLMQWLYDYTAP